MNEQLGPSQASEATPEIPPVDLEALRAAYREQHPEIQSDGSEKPDAMFGPGPEAPSQGQAPDLNNL